MKKILALALVVVLAVTAVTGATLAYFTDTDEVKNTFSMGKVDITLDETNINKPDGDRVQANDYTGTNMVPGHSFTKDPIIHVQQGSEESYIFMDVTINKFKSLFWVMAADAAEDETINLPLYDEKGNLASAFANKDGVFSSTSFVTFLMANNSTRLAILNKWFKGIEHAKWDVKTVIPSEDGKYLTVRMAYKGDADGNVYTVDASAAQVDIKFMDSFEMPNTVTQKMISDGVEVGKMQNAFNTTAEEFHMNFKAYAIQADTLSLDQAYDALFN